MQVNATSDNYQMGELIVRYLFDDLMGGKGTVIALTHRPHPGVVKRCEAFDDIIKEYPDIQLITEQHVPAEQPINDAEEITANLLTANPDKDSVTAIFAAWDEPAIGAAKALAEAGRDEVIVTGVDGNEQAVQMIKDGSCLKATVKQNFEGMADIVCQQMEKYYAGETIEKGEMLALLQSLLLRKTHSNRTNFPGAPDGAREFRLIQIMIRSWKMAGGKNAVRSKETGQII